MQGVKGTTDVAARREWNRLFQRKVGPDGLTNSRRRYLRLGGYEYVKKHTNIVGDDGLTYHQRRYRKYREGRLANAKKCVKQKKDKLYEVLGGYICNCCNETEPMFLTIDHINGGGRQHRISSSKNGSFYYGTMLKDPEVKNKYQVLCLNCNQGRWRNGGICPHRRENSN